MSRDRLQEIEEIYHAALEQQPNARAAFIAAKCGDDADLRREVESLLPFSDSSSNILNNPPEKLVAGMVLEFETAADFEGRRIGRYEVGRQIGKGGMGTVYVAGDTLLERQVAIKFLNPDFSRNADKLRRFTREAKAASALNHPNILTVHEIGEADGVNFIVTEFIEGKTLREFLFTNEAVPFETTVRIFEQIAEALSTAHRAGIIHRDIKPENVMIRDDGYVKVLDFGLAKLTRAVGGTNREAMTDQSKLTAQGMMMGTVSYMSPEQARVLETDARTDLWSFGAMLYEVVTRSLPFVGETPSDTMASILTKEPPRIAFFASGFPTKLQEILDRALQKEPDLRYQSAREMMDDLSVLRTSVMSGDGEFPPPTNQSAGGVSTREDEPTRYAEINRTADGRSPETDETLVIAPAEIETVKKTSRGRTIAAIGFLFAGALAFLGYSYIKTPPLVETTFNRTTFDRIPINASVELAEVSPDNRYVGYVERKGANQTRLVLRQLETGAEKEIVPIGGGYVRDIGFSPDGNYIYYAFETVTTGTLTVDIFRVPLLGGEPEPVVRDIARTFSIAPDGNQIAFVRTDRTRPVFNLVVFNLRTKQERTLITTKDRELQAVAFAPDQTKIAVFASDEGVRDSFKLNWIPAGGGELTKVSETSLKEYASLDFLQDGSGLVIAGRFPDRKYGQLYKISFPHGEFAPLTTSTSTFSRVSVSGDGRFLVALQNSKTNGIWELDLTDKSVRQTVPTTKNELKVEDVTPDGRLLVTRTDDKGKDGLLIIDADGANEKFLTLYNGENSGPLQRAAISNDGEYCYFVSDNDVWRIKTDGTGKERLTETPQIKKLFGGVAADSGFVMFGTSEPYTIRKLDLASRTVTPVVEREGVTFTLFGSRRNGDSIAYVEINEDPKRKSSQFLLGRFDGLRLGESKPLVSVTRSKGFVFSNDGEKVYFTPYVGADGALNDSEMVEKDLATGKLLKITDFKIERILSYTISRDGKKLYLVRGNSTDEVVLLRNTK